MAKYSFKVAQPIKEKKETAYKATEISDFKGGKLKLDNSLNDLLSYIKTPNSNSVSTTNLLDEILVKAKNDELNGVSDKKISRKKIVKKPLDRDLVMEFSEALINKDIELLTSILDDNGKYVIIDHKFELPIVGKTEFITFLKRKLHKHPVTSFKNDFCNGCFKGNLIMFYNDGAFPWNVLEQGFGAKSAFKFTIINNKISTIRFCHNFQQKQNKMDYAKYKEIYAEYSSHGYGIDDTVRLAKAEWNK